MTYDELQAAFRQSERRRDEVEREAREAWRRVSELESERDLWRQCEPGRAAVVAVVEVARKTLSLIDSLTDSTCPPDEIDALLGLRDALARLDAEGE